MSSLPSEKNRLINNHSKRNGCPHHLPVERQFGKSLKVLGAPNINPEVGEIVFHPKNRNRSYIRLGRPSMN